MSINNHWKLFVVDKNTFHIYERHGELLNKLKLKTARKKI